MAIQLEDTEVHGLSCLPSVTRSSCVRIRALHPKFNENNRCRIRPKKKAAHCGTRCEAARPPVDSPHSGEHALHHPRQKSSVGHNPRLNPQPEQRVEQRRRQHTSVMTAVDVPVLLTSLDDLLQQT
jgi:hypothetical protein